MKIIKSILAVSLLSIAVLNAEETKNIKSTVDVNQTTPPKLMKTVFFPLKHYNAAVIRVKIKPLVGREAKIISFKYNNTLVLRAYPESIKKVEEVIKELNSVAPLEATIVKFKKTPIKDIYEDINKISKSLFHQDIYPEPVTVLDSNVTNSLILVGKKENRNKLLQYIKLLDIEGGFTSESIKK